MKLIDFYGQECPHCLRMMPLIDKVAKETGTEIERLEVWHNKENAEKMKEYYGEIIQGCGGAYGVPVLVEPESRRVLCGAVSYEVLRDWVVRIKE